MTCRCLESKLCRPCAWPPSYEHLGSGWKEGGKGMVSCHNMIAKALTSGGLGAISDVAHVLPQRLF